MNVKTIGISDNRLLHSRQVAARCFEYARGLFDWDAARCEDMFLLGFLHDLAYHFVSDQREHEHAGGNILRRNNYRYWGEVYGHGSPNACCETDEAFILNLADMTVDGAGNRVTLTQRLEDIASRYGQGSVQYRRASLVVDRLQDRLEEIQKTGAFL